MNFIIDALRELGVPAELSGRNDIMVEGRHQLARVIRESIHNTDGHCKGVFYWEPECKPGSYKLGAFTSKGRPTVIMEAYKDYETIE